MITKKPSLFSIANMKPPPEPQQKQETSPPTTPTPTNIRLHAEIEEQEHEETDPDDEDSIIRKPRSILTYSGKLIVTFELNGKEMEGIPFTCESLSEEACATLLAAFIQRGN